MLSIIKTGTFKPCRQHQEIAMVPTQSLTGSMNLTHKPTVANKERKRGSGCERRRERKRVESERGGGE